MPLPHSTKRLSVGGMGGRTRSASAGRDKKSDLRARYWAFLFENLQHAIDELYQTCETDENISECKEVILVLENYTREFHNLAEWFRVKWEYENTPPPQRPNSLAWEIRKSSPGKVLRKSCQPKLDSAACRELILEMDRASKSIVESSNVLPLTMKLNLSTTGIIKERVSENGVEPYPTTADALLHPIDLKTKPSKPRSIDCSSQTENDSLAVKKTVPVARKLAVGSSLTATHPKKVIGRNLSIPVVAEKGVSSRRLSGCVSPRKPMPGRNVAAPVFVPRKKISLLSKEESKVTAAAEPSKVKISRSQSDTVFETTTFTWKGKPNEKPYGSVECVKSVVKEESHPRSPTMRTMQVITEHKPIVEGSRAMKLEEPCVVVVAAPEVPAADVGCRIAEPPPWTASASLVPELPSPPKKCPAIPTSSASTTATRSVSAAASTPPSTVQAGSATTSVDANAILPVSATASAPSPTVRAESAIGTASSSCIPVPATGATSSTAILKDEPPCPQRQSVATEPPKKLEVRKIPFKNSTVSRLGVRHHDVQQQQQQPRQQQPQPQSSSAKRKANSTATGCTSPRVDAAAANQNYVRNVGVPKTFGDAKSERRPNADPNGQPANGAATPPDDSKLPRSSGNYVTAIKANTKRFQEVQQSERRYPMIERSKTSIDMKSKSQAPAKSTAAATAASKTGSEDRDLPPRSRRCSKDTDGWETVISRSRRSIPSSLTATQRCGGTFDMTRRFYEPSPSTSLPTLAIAVSKEKSPESVKSERGGPKNRHRNNSHEDGVESGGNENARSDYNYKLSKERPIISSTAWFTSTSARRKKSGEKDAKKAKPKEGKRKSSRESDQAREDLLNEESLRRSKELYEKEISLQLEISELQNADVETDDVDSDGTEVDADIAELCQSRECDAGERRARLETQYSHVLSQMSWAEQIEALDKLEELIERDPTGKSLKCAKNFTSLKQFEEFMTRWPGRALELHQKLSSPSRKRVSPDSTILQHKARQVKAKQNRDQRLQDKSAKIKELRNKMAEVKAMQVTLAEEGRKRLAQKLKRAEENRNLHLKNIKEKAHDEAKKQKEIAFINELEAQNKRHDFYALCQEQEDRLQSILEERQRRQEEKAATKASVEERRKAIEAGRQEKIEELQEKMRKREERIDRELQEKERERIKMAREKARDREDRLLALQAAQIANAEELQKKIQQKLEDSARRHEESIELKRRRAIEIGTPRLTPYQVNKLCTICNVLIDSEVFLLSHLKGPSHLEAVKKYREQFEASVKFSECSIITDAPADILNEKKTREKERQKTLRKRCKKIRQRLSARSEKYLKTMSAEKEPMKKIDSPNRRRILKLVKDIEKLINAQSNNGIWPNNAVTMLERSLFEIIRVLEKGDHQDQKTFKEFDGFLMLSKIYNLALDLPKNMSPYLPLKCFVVASNLYTSACSGNVENCLYVLLSYDIVQILELLLSRLNLIMPNSDDRNGMVVYKADTVADVLMNLCSIILANITPLTVNNEDQAGHASANIARHLQDVVSYIVCTGIVDKLAVYCSSVHDNKSADSYFLLHSIQLLTRLVETRRGNITDKDDCTSLMATLKATDLVGAVSMLYAMLLHQDSMSPDAQSFMMVLHSDVVNVVVATLQFFNRVCELNLEFFQNILGAEGISLQVRHIISYLLKYCVQNDGYRELLHKVIEFIGFFAIHHHDNQMILQSGSTPTVLQQLSSLPFAYFSNPSLVRVLFPTLLACCVDNPQNRMILDQEMSFQLLDDFKNSEQSNDIPLVRLLH